MKQILKYLAMFGTSSGDGYGYGYGYYGDGSGYGSGSGDGYGESNPATAGAVILEEYTELII